MPNKVGQSVGVHAATAAIPAASHEKLDLKAMQSKGSHPVGGKSFMEKAKGIFSSQGKQPPSGVHKSPLAGVVNKQKELLLLLLLLIFVLVVFT